MWNIDLNIMEHVMVVLRNIGLDIMHAIWNIDIIYILSDIVQFKNT